MIGELLHESASPDDPLRFPEGSTHTDTEALGFIARRDGDLVSDYDTLAPETRITKGLTGGIEGVAVDMRIDVR